MTDREREARIRGRGISIAEIAGRLEGHALALEMVGVEEIDAAKLADALRDSAARLRTALADHPHTEEDSRATD